MRPKTISLAAASTVLGSCLVLFAGVGAAQEPTHQAWTQCELQEVLPAGDRLIYRSTARAGETPLPEAFWSSPRTSPIRLKLHYVRGSPLGNGPFDGQASFILGPEPAGTGYKVAFDFGGGEPQDAVPMVAGRGNPRALIGGRILLKGFAKPGPVKTTVYEGDRQIAETTFEPAASDHVMTGLDAFAQRAQAADPAVCHTGWPPLPVAPFPD